MIDSDGDARAAALDATRSFIVQAPAGSRKTELLIRRYLVLLTTVQEPEQVVAITFTRKAAAEMRQRVLRALRKAAAGETGESAHERTTLDLARTVVARDVENDWGLLAQPQRLRVDTLDAFNLWLAKQLPLLADGVAAAQTVDDATELYRRAARQTLRAVNDAGVVGDAVRTLARTLGSDFDAIESLLASMLPKRDQWLQPFVDTAVAALRVMLERALRRLVDERLDGLATLWPGNSLRVLQALAPLAARVAKRLPIRAALTAWLDASADDRAPLAAARAAAAVLLTEKGQWRKKLTVSEGFGPEHPAEREKALALLKSLEGNEALRFSLEAAAKLPDPHYSDTQWQQLAALRVVLVHLVTELKVLFAEGKCVDFVELGLAARRALGQVDAPSELLLGLDRRIQHLLVDEFQDTSQSQRKLLELLTAGWEQDDGRTLFLVGDPMQSIYRFRDADMSLFLKAKQRGIGSVHLDSVTLTRNFRSAPAVVDWVNDAFRTAFPATDDLASGIAGFHASAAVREQGADQRVTVHALRTADANAEVERVIAILEQELARDAEQSIAVLVRSRNHLAGLRSRLRSKGWPVHAVELEALDDQPLAQDLVGLSRALLHHADRIAWLAILRAPWCGLGWADLHALCANQPRRAVWDLLHDAAQLRALSDDGRARAAALTATLEAAFARRGDAPLARWIEQTWHALDGPECLDDPADLRVAEQVFALLAAGERRGDLDDPSRLGAALARAQPQSDPPRGRGIEIMTMHRAKGLEFDTVVLLGLARTPPTDKKKALYWLERVAADGADDLLVAPLTGEDTDRLSDFVRHAEQERDVAERARLLYVATTRARDRLNLVARLAPTDQNPAGGSLLVQVWPHVAAEFGDAEGADAPLAATDEVLLPALRRLTAPERVATAPTIEHAAEQLTFDAQLKQAPTDRPEFAWAGQAAVHVGTIVHRYLQRIAEQGVETWSGEVIDAHAATFERELRLLGVDPRDLAAARTRVSTALNGALADPRGRWLLERRGEGDSELSVTVRNGVFLEHVRLDRTFVADGTRWIIDFKTSQHEGADVDAFLASEVERYRPQLDRYAHAIAAIDRRPIEVGLYFPLLRAFRSWRTNLRRTPTRES